MKVFLKAERSRKRLCLAPNINTPETEFPNRPALDRDAVVAVVDDPDVAELVSGSQPANSVPSLSILWPFRVSVIAVGADQDAVVGAVEQVAVERRVGRDRVAAAHVARGRLTVAEGHQSSHGEREDHQGNAARRSVERDPHHTRLAWLNVR